MGLGNGNPTYGDKGSNFDYELRVLQGLECIAVALETTPGSIIVEGTGTLSSMRCGASNTASGSYSTVFGRCNISSGFASFVGGGNRNKALHQYTTVSGGYQNCITDLGNYQSTIGGGRSNIISVDGCGACIEPQYGDTIGGGTANCIFMTVSGYDSQGFNTISGGNGNTILGLTSNTISGGAGNTNNGCFATIGGGVCNSVSGRYTTISGGCGNKGLGDQSTISGGVRNSSQALGGFIGGGNCNHVCNVTSGCLSYGAVVSGGVGNNTTGGTWTLASCTFTVAPTICNAGQYSFIGGGLQNRATGIQSTIAGGRNNTAAGCRSTIGGGTGNTSNCFASTISGGYSNTASNNYVTISGGIFSTASGFQATVGGGNNHSASGSSSTIAGGLSNTASGYISAIAGGWTNLASGACSGILGGKCNVANQADSFIVGSNITTNRACTAFVNNLSIMNIPTSSAGLPSKAVWSNAGVLTIVP